MASDGVTNWKAVTPEHRKKIGPIVRHYMKQAHPFTACVRDNEKRFGPDRAKRICAVVKDMGKRSTKWRKGGKVSEAAEDLEGLFNEVWAPVLDAEGVTVEELADWSEMVEATGVLEAVEIEPGDLVEAARVVESRGGLVGHQRRDRVGKYADVPGVGDDAPQRTRGGRLRPSKVEIAEQRRTGASFPGRGPNHSLKRFSAMRYTDLKALERKLRFEGNDPEAEERVAAEIARKAPTSAPAPDSPSDVIAREAGRAARALIGDPARRFAVRAERLAREGDMDGARAAVESALALLDPDKPRHRDAVEALRRTRRSQQAATKAPLSHARRRDGESLAEWGKRLQAGDKRNEAKSKAKPAAKSGDFERQHKRGRGGKWIVMEGDTGDAAQGAAAKLGVSKLTTERIKQFQRRHGLQVDGKIGKQTAAALLGHRNAKSVAVGNMTPEQRTKLKRLRRAQEALEDVRFRPADLAEIGG